MMKKFPARGVSSIALALLSPAIVLAAEPTIRDDAEFFSSEAVQQAMTVLKDIQARFNKQVAVETFASIPEDLQGKFKSMDKSRFYHEWGYDRGKALGLNGIHILIVRMPGRLEIVTGEDTQKRAFPAADRSRLSELMTARFKAKKHDQALVEGVRFIQSRMAENLRGQGAQPGGAGAGRVQPNGASPTHPQGITLPTHPTRSTPSMGTWMCLGVGVLIAFLLIRAARGFRGRSGAGAPPMGGGYAGGYGGGGGFGSGLMGGLLGGMFGGWLSDRWSGHNHGGGGFFDNSGPSNSGGDLGGSGSSGGDFGGGGSDFGGGGSDFGGGGDFGGTDSSGGDF